MTLIRLPTALALMIGGYLMHSELASLRATCRTFVALDWGLTIQTLDVGQVTQIRPRKWQRLLRTAWRITDLRIGFSTWGNCHTRNLLDLARFTRLRSLTLAWSGGNAPKTTGAWRCFENQLALLLVSLATPLHTVEQLHLLSFPPDLHNKLWIWLAKALPHSFPSLVRGNTRRNSFPPFTPQVNYRLLEQP
jgi:hypothetical protein